MINPPEEEMPSPASAEPDPEIYVLPDAQAGDPSLYPLDWNTIFGRAAPLVLEIGTGNGVFLAAEAARNPEINYVGIERAPEFFGKFKRRVVRHGLTNVRCVCIDARDFLPEAFPPASLQKVICIFSDPWPKRRHSGRRVFRPSFVPVLEQMLVSGGRLFYKTDVGWYFNLTVNLFRRQTNWRILEIGPMDEPRAEAGEVVTNFEGKARRSGVGIWGFVAEFRKD